MINVILSKMLRLFNTSQKKLFFISLLHIFMSVVIMVLCGAVPLLGLCIVLIMTAGLRIVFLSALLYNVMWLDYAVLYPTTII